MVPGMFCPKCHALLYREGDELICRRCGHRAKIKGTPVKKIETRPKEKDIPVFEGDLDTLPRTRVTCPACGNDEAWWYMRQTRAADEPTTTFYICTRCKHRWREY